MEVYTYTHLYCAHWGNESALACNANPALTKFYSINLTGINQPTTSQPQQIVAKSNGTTSPFFLPSSLSLGSAVSNSTLAQSNSTNTTSVVPVFVNSSSIIDPSSTQSSSSSSSGHNHTHHHSNLTHHSSSSSSREDDSSSHNSHTHDNGNGGHNRDSHFHHDGGSGFDSSMAHFHILEDFNAIPVIRTS